MDELEQDDKMAKMTEAEQKEEETVEELLPAKAINKNLFLGNEPSSETSSLAPDDELTLVEEQPKIKMPRKLIEDEQRAKGRIAWPVWKTYFKVGRPLSASS